MDLLQRLIGELNIAHIGSLVAGLSLLFLFGWVVRKHVPPPPQLAWTHLSIPVFAVACLAFATGSKVTVDLGNEGLKIEVTELQKELNELDQDYKLIAKANQQLGKKLAALQVEQGISIASSQNPTGDIVDVATAAGAFYTLASAVKAADLVDTPTGDIVDVATGAGVFSTLVEAVKAADLVDTLKGQGPFTVFAPTDEAFAKIPQADLDALLADKKKLTAVLTYHVVPGKVMAADVVKLDSANTIQGESLTIDTSDGVKVDDATVVKTDIMTSNGVIHVIDTVLMPN